MIDGEPQSMGIEQEEALTLIQTFIERRFNEKNLSADSKKLWEENPQLQRDLSISTAKGFADIQFDNTIKEPYTNAANTMELMLDICTNKWIEPTVVQSPHLRKLVTHTASYFLNESTFVKGRSNFGVSYAAKITSALRNLQFTVDIDPGEHGNIYTVTDSPKPELNQNT